MATTNFNRLLDEQKTVWSTDVWKEARQMMVMEKYVGGNTSLVHRITELRKTEKGSRAVITLVPDLTGDGVVGDNSLEGNEEEIVAHDQVILIDQLRNANRNKGRIADQKTVVTFREQSRDVLAHWLADRLDQLFFLTLAGAGYGVTTGGATRTGSQFPSLEFAATAAVAATANRRLRWDVDTANTLKTGGLTASLVATDIISWEMLVKLKAYAKTQRIRPIRGLLGSGTEVHVLFVHTEVMADLKQDSDFLSVYKEALPRSPNHPLLKGAGAWWVDGLLIVEHEYVYHSDTWGAGTIKGAANVLCGAQALGYADLGMPHWDEEGFDYDNQQGISIGKICGFLPPLFPSSITGATESFNRIVVYTARTGGVGAADA